MLRWIIAGTLAVALVAVVLVALLFDRGGVAPPDVAFAMETHVTNDPDAPGRTSFIDFAELEHRFPLTPADRMKITPDNLKALTQEQLDQIYARLPAGPIPDGVYLGGAFFPAGRGRIFAGRRGGRRHHGPGRHRDLRRHRARRHLCLEGQGVRSRRHGAAQPDRGPQDAGSDHRRRCRRHRDGRDPAQGLSVVRCADPNGLAAVPGQAPLRPEPAGQPARIGHHRLRLQRRSRSRSFTRTPITGSTARGCASATRSAWCGRASISAGPTSTAPSS